MEAHARQGRGLLPDDTHEMWLATDAQISPDGTRIAYVLKKPDRARDTYVSNIWLIDTAGGSPVQLTRGSHQDVVPRWSPDGRQIAFLSDRFSPPAAPKPVRNLFVVDLDRSDVVRQLTKLRDDVSLELSYPVIAEAFAWSPDAKWICVSAKPPFPPGTEPTHAYTYERLRYKSGDYGYWDGRRKHLWLVAVESGAMLQLTRGDFDCWGPVFSPDGTHVAFSCNRNFIDDVTSALPDSNPYQPKDVFIVPVDGRGPMRCLSTADGPNQSPAFSPDGTRVAYFGHRHKTGAWGQNTHLWLTSADGGEPRDLLAEWDHLCGSHVMSDVHDVLAPTAWWTPDASHIYFVGTVRGSANIFSVAVDTGAVSAITKGEHEVQLASFSTDRRRFAALIGDEAAPASVWAGIVGHEPRSLIDPNDGRLADVFLARAERFVVNAKDGLPIDCFLLKPPDFDPAKKYPLVLMVFPSFVHGPGFNFEYQMFAGRGCLVLYTNPRGATSYGERYMAGSYLRGDWFSDDDDLMRCIDAVIARGYVDPARLAVTGDAYGGAMANWLITQTNRFAVACAHRGAVNLTKVGGDRTLRADADRAAKYARISPMSYVDDVATPHLLIYCIDDRRAGPAEAEEFFVALRSRGKTARLVLFRSDVHFLSRMGSPGERAELFRQVRDWFDAYLFPAPAKGPAEMSARSHG